MSASSSVGASTSPPSIAHARGRSSRLRMAAPASSATAITPSFGNGPENAAIAITGRESRGCAAPAGERIPGDPLPCDAMRLVKLVMACGLTAVLLAACGIKAKPVAGSAHVDRAPGNHAIVDDPRPRHVKCLRKHHYAVREYRTTVGKLPAIQVGTLPAGPTIVFEPTDGIAEGLQMQGNAQAAEVIGPALLYPHLA